MQENVSWQLALGCRRLSGFQLWCLTKLLPKPIGSKASALLLHAVHPGKDLREILCCCLSVQRTSAASTLVFSLAAAGLVVSSRSQALFKAFGSEGPTTETF